MRMPLATPVLAAVFGVVPGTKQSIRQDTPAPLPGEEGIGRAALGDVLAVEEGVADVALAVRLLQRDTGVDAVVVDSALRFPGRDDRLVDVPDQDPGPRNEGVVLLDPEPDPRHAASIRISGPGKLHLVRFDPGHVESRERRLDPLRQGGVAAALAVLDQEILSRRDRHPHRLVLPRRDPAVRRRHRDRSVPPHDERFDPSEAGLAPGDRVRGHEPEQCPQLPSPQQEPDPVVTDVHQAPAAGSRQASGEVRQPGKPELVAEELRHQAVEPCSRAVAAFDRLGKDPGLSNLDAVRENRTVCGAPLEVVCRQEHREYVVQPTGSLVPVAGVQEQVAVEAGKIGTPGIGPGKLDGVAHQLYPLVGDLLRRAAVAVLQRRFRQGVCVVQASRENLVLDENAAFRNGPVVAAESLEMILEIEAVVWRQIVGIGVVRKGFGARPKVEFSPARGRKLVGLLEREIDADRQNPPRSGPVFLSPGARGEEKGGRQCRGASARMSAEPPQNVRFREKRVLSSIGVSSPVT